MPELPEVETTRRGLAPLVAGATVTGVVVRNRAMRQPITRNLPRILTGRRIDALERRAKYLLFRAGDGTLIVHLGMSG
ncbi:MAG TPA: DNA-formamidopyrimidine glycosylase family protein, partial [Casimicrobiaceae bacterium]|nr:DNA-formamidopyrimidine glycosylase family protein [Casimicrobiaceae bacterium]